MNAYYTQQEIENETSLNLTAGCQVKINTNIDLTHEIYHTCTKMREMKGGVYQVDEIIDECVRINGYKWAKEDVLVVGPPAASGDSFIFNIEDLVI